MKLLEAAEGELFRSNIDHKHPFRYFSLATFGRFPEVRTVVKRMIHKDLSVLFFSDSRTPKIQEIRNNSKVTALFYHPKKKLQIRIRGNAKLVDQSDEHYSQYVNQVQQSTNLKDYTTLQAPGSFLETETVAFGEEMYFAPVIIQPLELEILQLNRSMHERCLYVREKDSWKEIQLVP